ncbi:Major facilitator superfamily (MFS) profile domain-containing protein [Caenorhabditis elegans]|uniref:Major facilitator superfamily (MFS) profile domain-containing protein n=1 Tax=Caenorhabditis elegans TaxID=6239 RepID=Q9NEI8_CAEEL|nr:Major facilitator superfamily (MFS) profile domain-containing protein [Caenorhabditis elegans]CAB61061.2 Major facilitator superfamily (MFS) profile domain-containing protein [Caenorhabditis elegans]|eukprot:NP_741656.2 Uncharacterized protein CELE_Y39B6A.41 [Caenorhabditis elegans]
MKFCSRRLFWATLSHAVFSQYGEIMAACLNLMNVPIKGFFRESLRKNYGVESEETFETIFSACASFMFIGLAISFAIMGKLMDGLGRKETILLRSFLGIIGSMAMLTSLLLNRFEFYVIGHLIAGMLQGFRVVLIIWIAECSPDSKRGLTSLFINSGGVIMTLLVTPLCLPSIWGNEALWVFLPCITALLATIHLILTIFLPKSPKHLFIQKSDEAGARRALRFYYGDENEKKIDEAIKEMIHENKQAKKETSGILDILQNRNHRFSLFLVFMCSLVPVFSGLNIKSQYLVDILISYGLTQSNSTIAIMVINTVSLPVSFIAPLIIEKYGRRPIFVLLTWLCAFEWLGMSIPEMANNFGWNIDFRWIFACFSAILGQCAVNLGMLVMAPIMISELCPHNIRATVSQFTQVPPIGIAVLEVFMFPTLRSQFGFTMFLFLATCCAALATILHNQMLETAGLAVDEIFSRLSGEPTLTRSNTSVGWLDYGSLWEKVPEPNQQQRKNATKEVLIF